MKKEYRIFVKAGGSRWHSYETITNRREAQKSYAAFLANCPPEIYEVRLMEREVTAWRRAK